MSLTTITFIIIIAIFAWQGYRKGFIGAITRILSWLIAYPTAIFLTKPAANLLSHYTSLQGLVVYIIAGSAIFIVTALVVTLALKLVSNMIPDTDAIQRSSKVGGATVGLFMGAIVGLLVVYVIDLTYKPTTKAVNQTRINTETADSESNDTASLVHNPELQQDSLIDMAAKKFVSTTATTAVKMTLNDSTATQLTQTFTQNPQTMLTHVQHLTQEGKVKTLLENPEFQQKLNAGEVESLMQDKNFQTLMNDDDMQAIMMSGDENQKGGLSEQDAAEKMLAAWKKVDQMKQDPRVVGIISDPEFQQQLNSPNKLPLMMNPKLKQLTDLMFNGEMQESQPNATTNKSKPTNYVIEDVTHKTHLNTETEASSRSKKDDEIPEKKIYRWTDDNGKVHYSDQPTAH